MKIKHVFGQLVLACKRKSTATCITRRREVHPPFAVNPSPDRLVCSTICFRQFPLAEALAAVRTAGFGAVDLGGLPGYCDHFSPREERPEALAEWGDVVRRSGLRVHTLNVGIGAFNDDAEAPAAVSARAIRCLHAANAVGARGVTFAPGLAVDRGRRPLAGELARIGPHFGGIAAAAAALGLVVSFEAPHRGGLIHDAREAVEFVRACGHPNARLIFDVGHHLRAGWSLADAWAVVGPWVEHVHLKDQAGGKGRYPLGAGQIDFAGLFARFEAAGYGGSFGFEFPDAAASVAAIVDLLRDSRSFLQRLGSSQN
jgi:sugar phosphate isomerase/epimerase